MNMDRKLFQKNHIISELEKKYPDRVFLCQTFMPMKLKRGRIARWADGITLSLFGIERKSLKDESLYFSYIKFAKDKNGESVAIVAGKSQFHWKNTSDLQFYDIDAEVKKNAAKYMRESDLIWDTDEFLIILNQDSYSEKEAFNNEGSLQKEFSLFG